MPTYREEYFSLINLKNKYITPTVIYNLFCYVSGLTKPQLLIKFDSEITNENYQKLKDRIIAGEPYQYVIGYSEFLGRKFYVDNNVLIPRQETEQLVTNLVAMVTKFFGDKKVKILDIGCGSGCISISLQKLLNCEVFAADISQNAINITEMNAKLNEAKVTTICSDIYDNIHNEKFDVIVSNPPYIESEDTIDPQVLKYEPKLALLAKPNTLYYEKIFSSANVFLNDRFILAFEIGEDMEEPLMNLVDKYFPNCNYYFVKDIYKKLRFLYILKGE